MDMSKLKSFDQTWMLFAYGIAVYPVAHSNRGFVLNNTNSFRVNENGLLYLLTASPPGKFSVKAGVATKFDTSLSNASSELSVQINWLPGSAFTNGILIRIDKATLSWFVNQTDVSVVSSVVFLPSAIH